ncbi:MAG TPA: hypothetical protein DEV93_13380 [Chloroflexi bacterium]|jgi:hypothetical protein|nr:hypothetical protein [Chloroflexota bacterium]
MPGKWAKERLNLVKSYGLSWKLSETEWSAENENKPRLVGRGSQGRIANFWFQWGVYVLYRGRDVYYIGISKRIGDRIRQHTKDAHKNNWDRFHWFGFLEVGEDKDLKGFLKLKVPVKEVPVRVSRVLHDMEAIPRPAREKSVLWWSRVSIELSDSYLLQRRLLRSRHT